MSGSYQQINNNDDDEEQISMSSPNSFISSGTNTPSR